MQAFSQVVSSAPHQGVVLVAECKDRESIADHALDVPVTADSETEDLIVYKLIFINENFINI